MTHILFRAELEKDRSIEFAPKAIEPLGFKDLLATLDDGQPAFRLSFLADDPCINGERQEGEASVRATITFNEQPTPFALVNGGWLPLALAIPQRFLVDRNVVARLRKLKIGLPDEGLRAFHWWMQFFKQGAATFNPLPYAWEGKLRRKQTFSEFVSSFEEGVSDLREALPEAEIITYGDDHYRAAYQMIEDFEPRAIKESEFLCAVCPLIAERIGRSREVSIRDKIATEAKRIGVGMDSVVFIAVLSCLFDDQQGKKYSIGRKLIKPKREYSPQEAFNALADLRHLELAAAGQTYFGNGSFSLSTCDQALAALWCALSPRGVSPKATAIEFTFDMTSGLFPRLSEEEINDLAVFMQNAF